MDNKVNKEELLKLLDIDFFKKVQDRLAAEFGIASVITDIDGEPLVEPSNFSSFCMNYVRKTKCGFNNCKACDAIGGYSAKRIMKPVIYTCHTGLTDFAAPIIVSGKLVGCFLCGQILTNNLPREHFEKVAKKLELDQENLDESIKELRFMPLEKVEYFANSLFEISTKISEFSHYQSIGNNSTKTLEDDLNQLFSIVIENIKDNETGFSKFKKKLKLLFKKNNLDFDSVYNNINNLNNNFFYVSSKIKDFNDKFKDFKV
ncbi:MULTISPECIES: PocR ligand-binding domain-containing protein [Fusobacterium]|uniref:PocR ligand-binding domain-containing protein n=1 Tax=Fusobacterium TaxID=848 RepID=UPI001F4F1DA1|nr:MULTISPECIES: PocR ligand-binding domain-containing protein [Fusobacterium]MCI5724505.1 PocR ligand-binding domain-containing protein [Fusobacterium sp.]MCI7222817.1 PocR ligand-binding domain-containing protein [Fusobacterium sp.]MDY5306187.1 PocR ligand-binding domain-containing protein [Fusobacterium gastrosuis]